MTAVAAREIAWIRRFAIPRSQHNLLHVSQSQDTPAQHIDLLEKFLAIAPYLLPQDEALTRPYLWHNDLHLNNIFIDENGHVTCIIDWQGAWAGPLLTEARQPYFLNYNSEMIMQRPKDFEDLEPDQQVEITEKIARSILQTSYKALTAEENPLLDTILRYPNGKIRTWPLAFVGDSWDGDIVPLRESLIKIER